MSRAWFAFTVPEWDSQVLYGFGTDAEAIRFAELSRANTKIDISEPRKLTPEEAGELKAHAGVGTLILYNALKKYEKKPPTSNITEEWTDYKHGTHTLRSLAEQARRQSARVDQHFRDRAIPTGTAMILADIYIALAQIAETVERELRK
jgi:hypothetical protein